MEQQTMDIPIRIKPEEAENALNTSDQEHLKDLLDIANSLISVKLAYRVCYVEYKTRDTVTIDGILLRSAVLRKNLEGVGRVFPYIMTIGIKLEKQIETCTDLLQKYYLDMIGNMALGKARKCFEEHLHSTFALTGLSFMSPGSLMDWPIEEQRPLFAILKGAGASIEVILRDNLLMSPIKSLSGIYFPTEVAFHNCQLCPRQNCEARRAQYSEEELKKYNI